MESRPIEGGRRAQSQRPAGSGLSFVLRGERAFSPYKRGALTQSVGAKCRFTVQIWRGKGRQDEGNDGNRLMRQRKQDRQVPEQRLNPKNCLEKEYATERDRTGTAAAMIAAVGGMQHRQT